VKNDSDLLSLGPGTGDSANGDIALARNFKGYASISVMAVFAVPPLTDPLLDVRCNEVESAEEILTRSFGGCSHN
jgi:hypothetical protein